MSEREEKRARVIEMASMISALSPRQWLKLILLVFIVSAFLFIIHSSWFYTRYTESLDSFLGDEPKYIWMIHSLLEDGDLDVSNFWGSKEQIEQWKQKALASGSHRFAGLLIFGKNKGIYCLHMPGLDFLIYPGYLLDSFVDYKGTEKRPEHFPYLPTKLYFVRLSLLAMGILSLLLLFRLAVHLFSSPIFAVLLFLPLLLNSPFPLIAIQLYPDGPALLFCVLVMNCLLFPFRDRDINDFFMLVGISFLPWLHQRFIPLSVALYLVYLFYQKKNGLSSRRVLSVSLLLIVLSAPYFFYFYSITGNPSPLSTSQFYGYTYAQLRTFPLGLFGQIFSTTEGLLWTYPWMVLFLLGIYWGLKKDKRLAGILFFIFFPYYLVCSAAIPWSGASIPVGRFSLPLLPVYLIFVGFALEDLYKRFSWKKLVFEAGLFIIILLNGKFAFFRFQFSYTKITPADVSKSLIVIVILALVYLSLFLGDKYLVNGQPQGPRARLKKRFPS